jgi:PKD repeat protein
MRLHTVFRTGFWALLLGIALAGCAPKADFTVDVTAGDAPLIVEFTDNSEVLLLGLIDVGGVFPVSGWEWDFGDLSASQSRNPNHTYKDAGLFSVSLTVDSFFGSDTVTRAQLIRVAQEPPQARFTATVAANDVRQYTFTDTSEPGTGDIDTWQWEFGDGSLSAQQNAQRTYTAPGTYTVRLTTCSAAGCTSAERVVTVPAFTGPTAIIEVENLPNQPQGYRFIDRSVAGNVPSNQRQWDFGDGVFASEANTTHTFIGAPPFTVTLRVCADSLCDTATQVIP